MSEYMVNAGCGRITGTREGEAYVFRGVPYAKPPVGALRFAAPERLEPFEEIFHADQYPNRSAQTPWDAPDGFYTKEFYADPVYRTPISEDSLYVNIWTPELDPEEKLPVLFYIHGGGFMGGCGHEIEFRTDVYAKRGVVLVTINYRLGIFGYFAHPWLDNEDAVSCGNYAVLDQIAALDWVRENIAAFGGDPDNITICGQSAGGMSVQTILASRLADGKYKRAVIQSASGYPNVVMKVMPLAEAFEQGELAVRYAGVSSLAELRALTMEELLAVQGKILMEKMTGETGLPFSPVIDGKVLTETITDAIANGHMNPVPVIIGCTKNDITVTPQEAASRDSMIHRSNVAYSLKSEEISQNPAYVYQFCRDLPGDSAGAFHSSELWYTFGTLHENWRPNTEGDFALSEEMVSCWSNFAKTGDPGNGWELCTEEHPFVKVFDVKA